MSLSAYCLNSNGGVSRSLSRASRSPMACSDGTTTRPPAVPVCCSVAIVAIVAAGSAAAGVVTADQAWSKRAACGQRACLNMHMGDLFS